MSANTPDQQITYPIGTDLADNPNAFLDMLADVEPRLVRLYTNLADRTARQLTVAENEMSGLSTENRVDIYDGAANVSLAARSNHAWLFRNSNATPKISDTTLTDDTVLTTTLDSTGSVYLFTCMVFYDTATAADIKFAFSAPASTGFRWAGMGLATTAGGTAGDLKSFGATVSGTASDWGGAGVGNVVMWRADGWIAPSATGTFALQWAQQNSTASNTLITHGSWLRVTRMS